MVTVLIAAGLIAAAAVTVGVIVKFMRSQTVFSRATGSGLAVESFLLAALQHSETYAGSAADSLAAGQTPTGLKFEMDHNGAKYVVAIVGGRVELNEDGAPCTSAPCALTTRIDILCASALCRAAYRVEFNPAVLQAAVPALGAAAWPAKPEDFTQLIGFDLYRRLGVKLLCDPAELFVTGLNKTTGEVTCVRPTTRQLAGNEIAKGMTYAVGTSSLEYKTLALKTGKCPARYVAQAVSPPSLEDSPAGTCVYRYKKEVPWMKPWPTASESVSQRFCPSQDYDAAGTGSCTGRVVSTTPGVCPRTCQDAQGQSYDCSYTVLPDTSFTIQQSVSGPNVTCTLTHTGTQQCGASWVGAVDWSGTCKLKVAETLPMGGG